MKGETVKDAVRVMERCDTLATISEDEDGLCRPYGSDSMRWVNEVVAGWMREAGMSVTTDPIGNLVGRYEGGGDGTFVLGSHLDTVRNAGRYDGILGVLSAMECARRIHQSGDDIEPPFSIEVAAFADEEGMRFGTTYLGSSAYAGVFDAELLQRRDRDGIPMRDVVREFGGEPDTLPKLSPRTNIVGYCELHIEQGPVLEDAGLPLGIVTAITGQNRGSVSFRGVAGHAGTVPMRGRRDALCAASEFVLAVEEEAAKIPGAVATVGEVGILPGTPNVIPGEARLSLDVRHQDDDSRKRARAAIQQRAEEIAASRNCGLFWQMGPDTLEHAATPMDERLTDLLGRAIEGVGSSPRRLPSGAGHDAARMAGVCPAAMLFVRCAGGISHNPAESVEVEDVAVALDVLEDFIRLVIEEFRKEDRYE